MIILSWSLVLVVILLLCFYFICFLNWKFGYLVQRSFFFLFLFCLVLFCFVGFLFLFFLGVGGGVAFWGARVTTSGASFLGVRRALGVAYIGAVYSLFLSNIFLGGCLCVLDGCVFHLIVRGISFLAGLIYGISAAHSVFLAGETPRCAANLFVNVGSTLLDIIIC